MTEYKPMDLVRVGLATPEEREEYESDKISINKRISRLRSAAAKAAKLDHCIICKKPCTSFCNSHSVPDFSLQRVANNGKVALSLHGELPALKENFGINQAGVFHLICRDCDSKLFQQYETPSAYTTAPTDQMLAQIALKNLLQMISKRNEERALYALLGQENPDAKPFTDEKIFIGDFDLNEYHKCLKHAQHSIAGKLGKHYHLCYFKVLDYVVPYACQSAIALIGDFEDNVINNLYDFETNNHLKYLHVAVFPLKSTTAVMLFIENGEKRYRTFYRQLNKLPLDEQLSAINYMIFSYTENVFLNPDTHRELVKNDKFMDVCRKITDYTASFPAILEDPLSLALREMSLSKRHDIPNLLSRKYAISAD